MSSIDSPPPSPSLRPLPQWAWALTVLMVPAALFVALGCARALSWTRALVLAVLSLASMIGFVRLMVYLESHEASSQVCGMANLAGLLMYWGWGFCVYRIGLRTGLWSPDARKVWRVLGWVFGGFIVLGLLLNLVFAVLIELRDWG